MKLFAVVLLHTCVLLTCVGLVRRRESPGRTLAPLNKTTHGGRSSCKGLYEMFNTPENFYQEKKLKKIKYVKRKRMLAVYCRLACLIFPRFVVWCYVSLCGLKTLSTYIMILNILGRYTGLFEEIHPERSESILACTLA